MLGTLTLLSGCLERPVGETHPQTQNIFVKRNKTTNVDKIDLLFMIDNSASMADKQAVLSAAVPQLLRRLTTPYCIHPTDPTAEPEAMNNPTEPCKTKGYVREFSPVNDIHIGVITSSLGDAGGDRCNAEIENDKGWLLGSLSRADKTLIPSNYLAWSQSDAAGFDSQIVAKEEQFRNFVTTTGESGCGFEMSLESWYRFLVDPEPPAKVDYQDSADGKSVSTARIGRDDTLLQQRKEFLRPDSLLAIVMLTDENDCSLRDSGRSLLIGGFAKREKDLKVGSSVCKTAPNDRCCYSCNFEPPEGCAKDPSCATTASDDKNDNLRCFDQKRRFGYDYLFPTARYVNALKLKTICPYQNFGDLDCACTGHDASCVAGQSFPNPLYTADEEQLAAGITPRAEANMIFLAGILGVPWQDIATPESLSRGKEYLKYRAASDIPWDHLLPDAAGNPPKDPLMRESIEARTGVHPITNEPIGMPTAAERLNQINGHEWKATTDLQFACTFDLTQPLTDKPRSDGLFGASRDCSEAANTSSCSCSDRLAPDGSKSPLCHDPKTGEFGKIQTAAKAYPGTRQLEVLRGHNESARDNSIVASICPKNLDWAARNTSGYGYNPAIAALVDRLKTQLGDTCLPRPLTPDESDRLSCAVIEASVELSWNQRTCAERGRMDANTAIAAAVRHQMKAELICDVEGTRPCAEFRLCELKQLASTDPDNALSKCQNDVGIEASSSVPGYCYIAPNQGIGNAELVAKCPASEKQKLRLVGDGQERRAPAPGWTFFACSGATYDANP
jgi:hypothetical protein